MNKRPLFWAVMCFALGEVLYIVADKGDKISTALVVLICLALIYRRLNVKWYKLIIYTVMLTAGFARIAWEEDNSPYYKLFGRGEYETVSVEYGDYTIEHMSGQRHEEYDYLRDEYVNGEDYDAYINGENDDAYSYGLDNNMKRYESISGVGIVDNVSLGSSGYSLTVLINYSETDSKSITDAYRIIIYGVSEQFNIGEHVRVDGEVMAFVPTGNPGEFNRANYYKARGIVGYGFQSSMSLWLLEGEVGLWYKLKFALYNLRGALEKSLESICDEKSKALYSGILLGDKTDISHKDMLLYRLAGIAHIFAISGLHIGIAGGLLYKLLRKCGVKFLPAALCSMFITVLYGIMTGFSFSTIRAVVMLGLSLLGEVLGRRYDLLTGIGLALGVLLIGQPFRILDGGLLLSFGAVAGVAVSQYIVKLLENIKGFKKLQKKKNRLLYAVISGFIFSQGINLVTIPLIAYTYFQIPMYSVFLNVIIVPLMSVTVFCGFLGALFGLVNQFFGSLIILPGVWSLRLYQGICTLLQSLPCDVINTGKPQLIELIIYYVVLFICLLCLNPVYISRLRIWIHNRKKKWIPYMRLRAMSYAVMGTIILIGVVGLVAVRYSGPKEEIIFLDVGQGDGTLIKTESGINMIVDGGSTSSDSLGEYVVYPALLAKNMGHIDYWFISHLDEDHISGLKYLLDLELDAGIKIDNIVLSYNLKGNVDSWLMEEARAKGINIIYMKQGDALVDKSFVIEAVHPGEAFDSDDRNEQSLVISYRTDKISVLFTGDIGEQGINAILEEETISGEYDILKVPHHGSKYSYSMLFLDEIEADVAVISCANRNSYGHPHKEITEGLTNAGCQIYRTDYMGAIWVTLP